MDRRGLAVMFILDNMKRPVIGKKDKVILELRNKKLQVVLYCLK